MAKQHLDTGDKIEFSMTMQWEAHDTPMWIRAGADTTVREKESAKDAWNRLTAFVEERLEEKIDEFTTP